MINYDGASRTGQTTRLHHRPNARFSDELDAFRPGPLRTLPFGVRNPLTLAEFLITYTFEARLVEKHVRVGARVDESKTFVRQPLDRTFSHFVHFLK